MQISVQLLSSHTNTDISGWDIKLTRLWFYFPMSHFTNERISCLRFRLRSRITVRGSSTYATPDYGFRMVSSKDHNTIPTISSSSYRRRGHYRSHIDQFDSNVIPLFLLFPCKPRLKHCGVSHTTILSLNPTKSCCLTTSHHHPSITGGRICVNFSYRSIKDSNTKISGGGGVPQRNTNEWYTV